MLRTDDVARIGPVRPIAGTLPAGCDDGCGVWPLWSALQARGALVGPCQPLREPLRRFGWSRSVERHHGRRCAWPPQQLRPPARAGLGHLDQVVAAGDVFFESVNGHGAPAESEGSKTRPLILLIRRVTIKRRGSRSYARPADHRRTCAESLNRIYFARSFSTGFARTVHRISTVLVGGTPSVFHGSPRSASIGVPWGDRWLFSGKGCLLKHLMPPNFRLWMPR